MALGPTQLPIGRGSFLLSLPHVGLDPTEIPSPGQGGTPSPQSHSAIPYFALSNFAPPNRQPSPLVPPVVPPRHTAQAPRA